MYLCARKAMCLILILAVMFLLPQHANATEHVVAQTDLQKAIEASSQLRQHNVDKVERFLTTEHARQAMKSLKVDPVKITSAVPLLSDEELSKIAAQTDVAQSNFAAGYNERELIYLLIVVLLVVAIIVILAQAID